MDGFAFGLSGWWDGTIKNSFAQDIRSKTENEAENNGQISGSGIDYQYEGNQVFTFDPNNTPYISIPHNENLSPEHEYTISARIFWEYDQYNQEERTILTKGAGDRANYSLSISKDGNIIHTLYRKVYQKDWECYDDNMYIHWCSDRLETDKKLMDLQAVQELKHPIPNHTWINIMATYSGEEMKLYLNGELVHVQSTIENYRSGKRGFTYWKWQRTTQYLLENNSELWIGATPAVNEDSLVVPSLPYSGMLDDIQFFDRALNENEVAQLFQLGICMP